jgi:hypothetical protein
MVVQAGCPFRVKSGPWRVLERCPLHPDEQTLLNANVRSVQKLPFPGG